MGIPRLTSYLDSVSKLWTTIELHDTRLVVDGSCLMYYLYFSSGLDCRFGGQYNEFESVIVSFFSALQDGGIEPFVVMDGAYDASNKKLATYQSRCKEEIRIAHELAKEYGDKTCLLPLLARITFIQVLSKTGIKFAVCDCEADKELASLANALNCPVLSNDSDFFIYDIQEGYIPVNSFIWDSKPLTANVFKARKLADHLKIPKSFLPLAGSLMGNDYVSQEMLDPFNHSLNRIQMPKKLSKKASRFISVANFLSGFKNLQDAIEKVLSMYPKGKLEDMQQFLNCSLEEYNISFQTHLIAYFNDGEITSLFMDDLGITRWLLKKFRQGLFPVKYMSCLTTHKQFLRVQVENMEEMSANRCSLKLRKVIYSILFGSKLPLEVEVDRRMTLEERTHVDMKSSTHETVPNPQMFHRVSEFGRDRTRLKKKNVEPYCEFVSKEQPFPSLVTIPNLSESEKQDLLLSVLECKASNLLNKLERNFQMLVATIIFWIKSAVPRVSKQCLEALLVSILKRDKESKVKVDKYVTARPPFDLNAAHSYAQWQCVLSEAINLNLILGEPLCTPFVPNVYCGTMVQEVLHIIKQGSSASSLVDCPMVFQNLYHIVTANITEAMSNYLELESKKTKETSVKKQDKQLPKQVKTRSQGQMLKSASTLTDNPFAVLSEEISSSDSEEQTVE